MRDLSVYWCGVVKFSSVKELNGGKFIRSNLIQHKTDKGKSTMIKVIEWHDNKVDPLKKDLEVEFTGYVRENVYPDPKDETKFISTGLEVIADNITWDEVFD